MEDEFFKLLGIQQEPQSNNNFPNVDSKTCKFFMFFMANVKVFFFLKKQKQKQNIYFN